MKQMILISALLMMGSAQAAILKCSSSTNKLNVSIAEKLAMAEFVTEQGTVVLKGQESESQSDEWSPFSSTTYALLDEKAHAASLRITTRTAGGRSSVIDRVITSAKLDYLGKVSFFTCGRYAE